MLNWMSAVALATALLSPNCAAAQETPAPLVQRYVIVRATQAAENTILLDTQTGRTWVFLADPATLLFAWKPVAVAPADASKGSR